MGAISWKRQDKYKNYVLQYMNSWLNSNWGKFTSKDFQEKYLATRASGREWITQDVKHKNIPEPIIAYLNGYMDAIRARIEREETLFVYKIFGKFYGCRRKDEMEGFPRYDVFPREVWANDDFRFLGMNIWKKTKMPYYGHDFDEKKDLPIFPFMSFYERGGVISFRIKHGENDPESSDTIGSFPFHMQKYVEIMRIAKSYNVRIFNMEEMYD